MIDEDKDPGSSPVAVADAPDSEIPDSLEGTEQPAGQEPAPEEDAKGDAPPVDDAAEEAEDPFVALDELIQNIAENDPDRLADAIEKLPEEHRARYLGPDEARVNLANEETSKQWDKAVETAQQTAATYSDTNIASELQTAMAQMAQVAKDRAQAYRDDREGSTANVVDAGTWTPIVGRQLGKLVTNAKAAQESQTRLEVLSDFVGALQSAFPVKLSPADVTKLQSIPSQSIKEWIGGYAGVYIEALQRNGAPVEDTTETKALTEQIAKINAALPGKGAKAMKGGEPSAKKAPTTIEEIDEALRSGPTADIDDLLKKREALVGQ